jgi:hypothetical protein
MSPIPTFPVSGPNLLAGVGLGSSLGGSSLDILAKIEDQKHNFDLAKFTVVTGNQASRSGISKPYVLAINAGETGRRFLLSSAPQVTDDRGWALDCGVSESPIIQKRSAKLRTKNRTVRISRII